MKGIVRNRAGAGMRKRGKKRFVFFIAAFLLILFMGESISASEGDRKLGSILSYDADGEALGGLPAVAMALGGGQISIFSGTSIVDEGAASYLFLGDQEFTAEYQGVESDTDSALFIVSTDAADTRFLDFDSAGEGETAYLHYLCDDGKLTENTIPITVTGYERVEEKGYYILDYTALQKDVEEMQDIGFYLPGAVINDAGNLVGILTPSLDVITYYLEEGRFSGNTEPPSEGSLFPDGGGSSERIKGRADEPMPTVAPPTEPTAAPTVAPTAGSTAAPSAEPAAVPAAKAGSVMPFLFGIISGGAMMAGGVILLLCVLKALKKQKKAVREMGREILPTMPLEEKALRLYLCCEGGVMDGRRYPITADGLLIGRAPECDICYPSVMK